MEEFVMSFLDLAPMIAAMRTRPADFEMDGSWLHHFPSDHRFKVDQEGNVRIDARCDCAILHVQRQQGRELWKVIQLWHSAYWRPMEINQEFAQHFRAPNIGQRLYRYVRIKLRWFLDYGGSKWPLRPEWDLLARRNVRGEMHREANS